MMTKSNGKGNGVERLDWLSKPHNREFSDMFGRDTVEETMEDDIEHRRRYDEIDQTCEALKKVNKRLRKKSLLASLRSREMDNGNEKV